MVDGLLTKYNSDFIHPPLNTLAGPMPHGSPQHNQLDPKGRCNILRPALNCILEIYYFFSWINILSFLFLVCPSREFQMHDNGQVIIFG